MKKIIAIILVATILSCTEDRLNFIDLLSIDQSRDFIIADGSDTVTYILNFNRDAELSLIDAKATVTNGVFEDNNEDELDIEPIRDINDNIEARVVVKSTTAPSDVVVEFNINEFITKDSLTAVISEPATINLQASAFNVDNNFDSEISFTGNLRNENGAKVSNGFSVRFEDSFSDGSPVNGSYREEALSTSNGQVSTIYSPGPIAPDQFINMKVIVLDENGNDTAITAELEIYITTD
ncbi:MAG: hypothetical protein ACWA5P_13280 [bacterium]